MVAYGSFESLISLRGKHGKYAKSLESVCLSFSSLTKKKKITIISQ